MTTVELWMPYPVSANSLWRSVKGRVIKSSAYQAWLKEAGLEVMAQRPSKIKGPYKITITAARPDRRRRDLGNLEKSVSDLLQSVGVIEDDCYAEMISMRWATSGDGVSVRLEGVGIE